MCIRRRFCRSDEDISFGHNHNRSPAASASQSEIQEARATLLQREECQGQVLRWTSQALVLHHGCARAGLRRRREDLGAECGSVSLRALQDPVFAQPGRGQRSECGGAGTNLGVWADSRAEEVAERVTLPREAKTKSL